MRMPWFNQQTYRRVRRRTNLLPLRLTETLFMKAKVLLLMLALTFCLALPMFAQHRVVTTSSAGRSVVANNFCRPHWHDSNVSWSIGIGFPFYGGYYGGYSYYGGYYPYGAYGYGYGSSYYAPAYYNGRPYYGTPVYGGDYRGSTVARVQERLARAGYYEGSIDGVMGPRTRAAVRAYERRHGLPVDGVIDSRLLATMGLA
jgi:Putative peptidoglycan binding domain